MNDSSSRLDGAASQAGHLRVRGALVAAIVLLWPIAVSAARGTATTRPATRPATQPWDGQVPLCWGGTLRFLGMAENSDTARWWALDGTALPGPPPPLKSKSHPCPLCTRQLCYVVFFDDDRVDQGANPKITIDGVYTMLGIGEGDPEMRENAPRPSPSIFRQYCRMVFGKASATKLTVRGEVEDGDYATFAIAKPGQRVAGPLKVEISPDEDGNVRVYFSGRWDFPHDIELINTRGHLATFETGFSATTIFGCTAERTFDCPLAEVREVHFRLCGLQRFVIHDVAADPGVRTSPVLSTKHIGPTLNGRGPVWTGALPERQWKVDLRARAAAKGSRGSRTELSPAHAAGERPLH